MSNGGNFRQQQFFGSSTEQEDEQQQMEKGSMNNVEMILNSLMAVGGADQLKSGPAASSSASAASSTCNFEGGNIATHPIDSATSSASYSSLHPHSSMQDQHKCRYCDESFADELKMQLHAISTHSTEILAQAFAAANAAGGLVAQNPMALEFENDVITQVAMQMAKANQMKSQPASNENDEHTSTFICNVCSRPYKSKMALKNHARLHHKFVSKISPTKKRVAISPSGLYRFTSTTATFREGQAPAQLLHVHEVSAPILDATRVLRACHWSSEGNEAVGKARER